MLKGPYHSSLEGDSPSTGSGESSNFSSFLNKLLERVVNNIGKVLDEGVITTSVSNFKE